VAHLRSRALLDSQLLLVVAGWLVSQVHIYRPRPLGLTGKHSLLNPGPRDRLAQSRLPAVLTAVWPCHRSCLVLSINLIHCGNEFRNSVPPVKISLHEVQ